MDVDAEMHLAHAPASVFAWVETLDPYPQWLDIVPRVIREADEVWLVDLRGRVGPVARVKRLRMRRVEHVANQRAVFARDERDGREHSPWILTAEVREDPGGSMLRMHMHYGGSFWGPVLERLLGDAIETSRDRLAALVATGPPPG